MLSKNEKVYTAITSRIIADIEAGEIPVWRKDWKTLRPCNAIRQYNYRGYNVLYAQYKTLSEGWEFPYFITYNECRNSSGKYRIKKSELSNYSIVVKWNVYTHDKKGIELEKPIFSARYFKVYNIDQLETGRDLLIPTNKDNNKILNAEEVINDYLQREGIQITSGEPTYYPGKDYITIPAIGLFNNSNAYYEALLHELVHSTGIDKRCKRGLQGKHAIEAYSIEELTAEIGATMLCARLGIKRTPKNDSAYVQGWLKNLKNDTGMIVHASQRAQKAVDYILNEIPTYKEHTPDNAEVESI